MSAMASQITGVSVVCSTVYWGADQRKHQNPVPLAFCEGNPPVTCGFPSQRANHAETISIWWRHHAWREFRSKLESNLESHEIPHGTIRPGDIPLQLLLWSNTSRTLVYVTHWRVSMIQAANRPTTDGTLMTSRRLKQAGLTVWALRSSSSSIYSIALGPRPLQAYTHSVNLTNTFRYTWKQRIGMTGWIVNLTPHKSFNALALVFNGHWNITLLTTKHLQIYYPIHELFSVQNRYIQISRDFL